MDNDELLIRVRYLDYLGFPRDGFVVLVEDNPALPEGIMYCYIMDDLDPTYNDKAAPNPKGGFINYAEIRRSDEIERLT